MTGGSIAGNTATIDPTIPPSDRCTGGGGLLNSNLAATATATLTNVLVSGNVTVTGGSGGGIHNCGGTVTLNGGAATKNQAGGVGGGIANFVGTARIGGATIGGPLAGRTVAFTLNGIPVGTATTNASGVATLANASLGTIPVGSYPSGVGASFAQNSPYLASSAAAALTIAKANTTTIVQNATATYGDATAMLRATVTNTGPGSTAPVNEGTVTFVVRQGTQTICAATSGTVSNGIAAATCPLGSLNAGGYSITATYSGGPNFNGSGGTAALQVARRVLWVKATDRTVGLRQPNPPTTPPAGCLVSATATSACWLELANGSTFAPGESWSGAQPGEPALPVRAQPAEHQRHRVRRQDLPQHRLRPQQPQLRRSLRGGHAHRRRRAVVGGATWPGHRARPLGLTREIDVCVNGMSRRLGGHNPGSAGRLPIMERARERAQLCRDEPGLPPHPSRWYLAASE